MDGKGYPDGLTGDQLDDLTKIIIVVDSYDAMTSKRNYRKNMSMEQAVEELFRCCGTQFEKNIVEFFSRSIIEFTPTKSIFSE
jgi:HD-GYP domain-containing protein (c-di-GMP phosphodiesterase class II)